MLLCDYWKYYTVGFSQLCTVCSMDDLFLCSVISTDFQVRYLFQLITANESRVGYLSCLLSLIEMFCFKVAWLHGFGNLLLHSLYLNDDCWLYSQLHF